MNSTREHFFGAPDAARLWAMEKAEEQGSPLLLYSSEPGVYEIGPCAENEEDAEPMFVQKVNVVLV